MTASLPFGRRAAGPPNQNHKEAEMTTRRGDWNDLVIICAGTAWDRGWYPSEKHIATRLSARAPVLYVDPSASVVSFYRRGTQPGLRIVKPGLAVLSPSVLPAHTRAGMRGVTSMLMRRAIRRAAASLGVERARAFVMANHMDLFGSVPADRQIVYATDEFVAGAELMGMARGYLAAEERRQAAHADRVIVVTEHLGRHWRGLGHDPVLIPNGCDTERFTSVDHAPLPDDVDLPRPIAGVFGRLSERIDLRLLDAVASRGHSLLLVGPVDPPLSLAALLARPNVRHVGQKPFEAMAGYLRAIDVGLTPYADSEFNRSSFPLKTIEYLSAGRLAVSTDLPAVRWLDTELIGVGSGPDGFADVVGQFMRRPRTPELVRACQAFAGRHSWILRTEQFAEAIGLPKAAARAGEPIQLFQNSPFRDKASRFHSPRFH